MRTVFLDTVGLLASWDSTDQWHADATRALDKMGNDVVLVTTSFVMLECGNAASRRPYRHLADEMRTALELAQQLVVPTVEDWDLAWKAYRRGTAGDAGIVDHVSFVVMHRMEIFDAFTNDRHFKIAGFNTLF